jgi:hypothetical protein
LTLIPILVSTFNACDVCALFSGYPDASSDASSFSVEKGILQRVTSLVKIWILQGIEPFLPGAESAPFCDGVFFSLSLVTEFSFWDLDCGSDSGSDSDCGSDSGYVQY